MFVTKEFAISLPQEVLFSHVLLVRRYDGQEEELENTREKRPPLVKKIIHD